MVDVTEKSLTVNQNEHLKCEKTHSVKLITQRILNTFVIPDIVAIKNICRILPQYTENTAILKAINVLPKLFDLSILEYTQ